MKLLKQSTAYSFRFGPFVDKNDAVTAKAAVSPTIYISKAGAAFGARAGTTWTYDRDGYYLCALASGDTDTVGTLRIEASDATTFLPVWDDYFVVPASVFNTLVTGVTDTSGITVAAVAGAVASVTGAVGSVTGNVGGNVVGSVASVAAAVTVTGTPAVNVTQIDGNTTVGNNATLNLKQLNIQNSADSAIIAKSTAAGKHGIEATGNTTGAGIKAKGGATGHGLYADGGSTSGHGIFATGITANSHGAYFKGGAVVSAGDGLKCEAVGTGNGLTASSADGNGLVASPGIVASITGSLSGSVGSVTGNVGGNVVGSVASVSGAVGSVTGNVGGNVVGSVASVSGAVGSVTGNVGGNVVGSVASVSGAVGSVTGNVGGNVVGSVASVVGNVGGSVASVVGNVGGNVVGSVASVLGDVFGDIHGDLQGGVSGPTASVTVLGAQAKVDVENAVWNAVRASHVTSGTFGEGVPTSGGGADSQWTTGISLPSAAGELPTSPTPLEVLKWLYMATFSYRSGTNSRAEIKDWAGSTALVRAVISDGAGTFSRERFKAAS